MQFDPAKLSAALQSKGYNPIDAENAARGPRAQELAKEYGVITDTGNGGGFSAPTIGAAPTINVQGIYDTANNDPEIKTLQDQIDQKNKALVEATSLINDNPFYSEGTRQGKIDRTQKKAESDIAVLTNQLTQKKTDASNKVNIALKQYDINNAAYQQQVQQFNSLLSSGALINASPADIANLSAAVGIPTSMIQSVIDQQKQKKVDPQVLTFEDDNGNATIAVVDKTTGETINSQVLKGVSKAKSTGSGTLSDKEIAADAAATAGSGATLKSLLQIYTGLLDPNTIYNIYNANSIYGAAKESPDELSKYGIKIGNQYNV